ncbi:unnamed protein product [Pleuronectes platessa]|uniref:Uncharacterized protein n=1 Tax=Pleuronectes platessa TaxID=8262 RepID=A0A9N7YH28_PLEPL|nr:unnamed protein product [Pleuronectes platessa]
MARSFVLFEGSRGISQEAQSHPLQGHSGPEREQDEGVQATASQGMTSDEGTGAPPRFHAATRGARRESSGKVAPSSRAEGAAELARRSAPAYEVGSARGCKRRRSRQSNIPVVRVRSPSRAEEDAHATAL